MEANEKILVTADGKIIKKGNKVLTIVLPSESEPEQEEAPEQQETPA